ncbi:MAG: fibrobacter succinogenes major paralogous domain-containing protein [Flavobacterium sp.]|nr:fibrobacter succinogenes major paralogous domain-containing protein [Flavobacterium sp.]
MKKYYFLNIILIFGLLSCTNEETKTQNQIAARPTVPIQNGEVQIGTQIWMTKNLNVSRYRNGDPIPQVANSAQWANLNTGAWLLCNSTANGPIYGKLYNWYAVNDSRGLRLKGGIYLPMRSGPR